MEFVPEVHQHSAGLILYYDNMNYINLRKYYSETLGQSALSIIHLENGVKTEFLNTRIPVEASPAPTASSTGNVPTSISSNTKPTKAGWWSKLVRISKKFNINHQF